MKLDTGHTMSYGLASVRERNTPNAHLTLQYDVRVVHPSDAAKEPNEDATTEDFDKHLTSFKLSKVAKSTTTESNNAQKTGSPLCPPCNASSVFPDFICFSFFSFSYGQKIHWY